MKTAVAQPRRCAADQAGVTLIEALVALLIMSFGMLALTGMQGNMRRSADLSKQRSEAVRLAQQDLEAIRAYSELVLPADPEIDVRAYAQIADKTVESAGDPDSNASFTLQRALKQPQDGQPLAAEVRVRWIDRAGEEQQVFMSSFVARVDPRLSGSLFIAPDGAPTRRPKGRHLSVPPDAKDMGDGVSAFKPPAVSSGVAWVFNNRTGHIVKLCQLPDHDISSDAISSADIDAYCTDIPAAYLLSGGVRFSTGSTPDPEAPNSLALPLHMSIEVAGIAKPPAAPAHDCFSNAPLGAPASMPDGVGYYCAVYPNIDGSKWTGRLLISGITLGSGGYRVCRYSADYNGDKKISNAEHPLDYVDVAEALIRQNFLIVAGTQSCPVGRIANPGDGHFYNSQTVVHQEKL